LGIASGDSWSAFGKSRSSESIQSYKENSVAISMTFRLGGEAEINRLGYGAMRLTGDGIWGEPKDRDNARKVLRRAVELGVNFIDTADSYGPAVSEPLIGEALAPYPKGTLVATKAGLTRSGPNQWSAVGRPAYLVQQAEMSLRWLKKDVIDLWQLHRIDPEVPVEESLGAIKRLQDQGKIRFVGLSEVTVAEIEQAKKVIDIVSVQNQYNISNRKSEAVLAHCERHGLAFIPWFPVASGKLAQPGGKLDELARTHGATTSQLSLAWLLRRSPVIVPIPGTSSVRHLEENMKAAKLSLSDAEWQELEAIVN
jgi:pyridoxine 4-dehydrogenase